MQAKIPAVTGHTAGKAKAKAVMPKPEDLPAAYVQNATCSWLWYLIMAAFCAAYLSAHTPALYRAGFFI